MLPARPTQEGQTDQLAQVTLAHRRGVAFLAAGSGRWQLAVSHQDGAGRVDLRMDCIDGCHVWVVSPVVADLLLTDQL